MPSRMYGSSKSVTKQEKIWWTNLRIEAVLSPYFALLWLHLLIKSCWAKKKGWNLFFSNILQKCLISEWNFQTQDVLHNNCLFFLNAERWNSITQLLQVEFVFLRLRITDLGLANECLISISDCQQFHLGNMADLNL